MKSIEEIRRENFRWLVRRGGGLSQAELARRMGVNPPQVQQWKCGDRTPESESCRRIEQAAQMAPGWMDQDHSATDRDYAVIPDSVAEPATSYQIDQNVTRFIPSAPRRPVLAKVIAGNFREAVSARTPDDDPWWEYPRHAKSGDLAAWLIVDGDSMDDGTSSSFRQGDLILVDPDAPWGSGDFVVIANGGDEWTFKRIRKDGPTWFMEALNPAYQPRVREIPTGWRVVAKVLEVMPKGRKVG